jgi:hypothetical protein
MSQDPHDQLLLQIRGAVAEYERSLIAELSSDIQNWTLSVIQNWPPFLNLPRCAGR